MNNFNTYYKTFSGSDTIVFISIPGIKPIALGTLTTVSYSTYRVKRPVSTLGRVNIAGFTRGQRTVAGTLVFTLINQHWVNELIDEITCLEQFDRLKPDELPLFDLMLVSANEYGSGIVGYIYGVDVTDDSGVISTNDFYTETTLSYIARDIDLLKDYEKTVEGTRTIEENIVKNYRVDVNGSDNVKVATEYIPSYDQVSLANNISYMNHDISISNIDLEYILCQFGGDSNIKIFTKSYYSIDECNNYFNSITNDRVMLVDIISSFTYNNKTKSYPKYVECVISDSNLIYKIKILVGD